MAPSAVVPELQHSANGAAESVYPRAPLKSSGSLDRYTSEDVTPVIGTEYTDVSIVGLLDAPNADDLIRDLAIKISERGVVFFRAQDDLTNERQKELIHKLGQLTGKPKTSTLHIHPVLNSERGLNEDLEISTISSEQNKKFYKDRVRELSPKKQSSALWHSDIAFEPVPAGYTSLRLVKLPKTGGDTLWASGYEIFAQPGFNQIAEKNKFALYEKPRGSPENVGTILQAVHPVVRTNPVTGWKSIYPVGQHIAHINGVSENESDKLLRWFLELVYENHDLQVRFKWKNPNDIAIWDNRSVFHTATFDYDGLGERFGNRAVGIGERPYFDPNSSSRQEALRLRPQKF